MVLELRTIGKMDETNEHESKRRKINHAGISCFPLTYFIYNYLFLFLNPSPDLNSELQSMVFFSSR